MNIDPRVLPMAYLNGEILPIENAQISVLDRGFLYGDAIYEVIPVYDGKLFRAASHITRLMNGLSALNIECKNQQKIKQAADWEKIFSNIVRANGGGNLSVYLQVSRGAGTYRDHAFPKAATPLIFAMCQRLMERAPEILTHGADAILLADTRWARCNIKATSLLANVLLRQTAVDQGAMEAILHADGMVTEGAASTIMIATNGTLVCAPNTANILPGTTRSLILELAEQVNIPVEIRSFSVQELCNADEVLLSAATKELTPVCRVDGVSIGAGKPGPLWQQLDRAYQNYKKSFVNDNADQASVAL